MTLIPLDERADLLKIRSEDRRITAQSWVRLRRGPNKGDLAHVLETSINSDQVRIAVMPRMPFTIPLKMDIGKGKRKRTPGRLPAQPFDPVKIKHAHGVDVLKHTGDGYYFQGKLFRKGMLIQTIQSAHTLERVLHPPLHEIKPFISAGFITPVAALAITSGQVLSSILPGDHISLIAGEQSGCKAVVMSCTNDTAIVELESLDYTQNVVDRPPFLLEAPLCHIRRQFRVGDNVRVKDDAGEHAGSFGLVVAVDDDGQRLTFIKDQATEHVSVSSY